MIKSVSVRKKKERKKEKLKKKMPWNRRLLVNVQSTFSPFKNFLKRLNLDGENTI